MASDEVSILDLAIGIGAALGADMEVDDALALPLLVDRPFDAATYQPRTHAPPPSGILRFKGLIPEIDEDILLREPMEHLSIDASMVIARRIGGYESISGPQRWYKRLPEEMADDIPHDRAPLEVPPSLAPHAEVKEPMITEAGGAAEDIEAELEAEFALEPEPELLPLGVQPSDPARYHSWTHILPPGGIRRFTEFIHGMLDDLLLKESAFHLSCLAVEEFRYMTNHWGHTNVFGWAIGHVLYLRPYVDDFSTQWVLASITLLTLGSVLTTYIGERFSDLKLGNGTSLLIFMSFISYLPASFGRTVAEAFQDGNYIGLVAIIFSFFLLVLSIVYVQEAERKIPINHASQCSSRTGGLQKSAYLPFQVNSSGVMPNIFSTSSLALPGTLTRFTGLAALKKAAVALNPGEILHGVIARFETLAASHITIGVATFLSPDSRRFETLALSSSSGFSRKGPSLPRDLCLIRFATIYFSSLVNLVRLPLASSRSLSEDRSQVLSRISVLGSAFLAILAAGPAVIEQTTHLTAFRGFVGTSVLILVGCATDTARKVQAEIISQKYKNIEFYDIDKYNQY
ncbi:preprotein translocase subunit SECY, chloroplastic-like [Camellia sinensis]|uniref:preprotein translocase subunit SECY, chloroplastic-like n=1 Tax=Camellia sinensis TaxID=4442 RepID=UPI0010357DE4|nr:preprotein translocase subunit SECY, chloroplastic-like [Camellia sinensis]